jgi:YggT family protein
MACFLSFSAGRAEATKAPARSGTDMFGLNPISWLLVQILDLYWWVIIIAVVCSWLVSFGVINRYNHVARSILQILWALTEPIFRPIRRILPPMGGLDLSPLVAILLVSFLRYTIIWFDQNYL